MRRGFGQRRAVQCPTPSLGRLRQPAITFEGKDRPPAVKRSSIEDVDESPIYSFTRRSLLVRDMSRPKSEGTVRPGCGAITDDVRVSADRVSIFALLPPLLCRILISLVLENRSVIYPSTILFRITPSSSHSNNYVANHSKNVTLHLKKSNAILCPLSARATSKEVSPPLFPLSYLENQILELLRVEAPFIVVRHGVAAMLVLMHVFGGSTPKSVI
jgi:hypothetical protein